MKHFRSVQAVSQAEEAALCEVDGIGPSDATRIREFFLKKNKRK
jgi:ERCC4-type nuclease